jgi:hypothetical protein
VFLYSSASAVGTSFFRSNEGRKLLTDNLGYARVFLIEIGEGISKSFNFSEVFFLTFLFFSSEFSSCSVVSADATFDHQSSVVVDSSSMQEHLDEHAATAVPVDDPLPTDRSVSSTVRGVKPNNNKGSDTEDEGQEEREFFRFEDGFMARTSEIFASSSFGKLTSDGQEKTVIPGGTTNNARRKRRSVSFHEHDEDASLEEKEEYGEFIRFEDGFMARASEKFPSQEFKETDIHPSTSDPAMGAKKRRSVSFHEGIDENESEYREFVCFDDGFIGRISALPSTQELPRPEEDEEEEETIFADIPSDDVHQQSDYDDYKMTGSNYNSQEFIPSEHHETEHEEQQPEDPNLSFTSMTIRLESADGSMMIGLKEFDEQLIQDWIASVLHFSVLKNQNNAQINTMEGQRLWEKDVSLQDKLLCLRAMKLFRSVLGNHFTPTNIPSSSGQQPAAHPKTENQDHHFHEFFNFIHYEQQRSSTSSPRLSDSPKRPSSKKVVVNNIHSITNNVNHSSHAANYISDETDDDDNCPDFVWKESSLPTLQDCIQYLHDFLYHKLLIYLKLDSSRPIATLNILQQLLCLYGEESVHIDLLLDYSSLEPVRQRFFLSNTNSAIEDSITDDRHWNRKSWKSTILPFLQVIFLILSF